MEQTFDHDIQAKKCYIYDFYHDDQPDKNQNMTYDNTTKTPIDAKFIINSYQSIDKDQVPYYLQFRPSQKYSFSENDDLYYYETDYHERWYRTQCIVRSHASRNEFSCNRFYKRFVSDS